MRFLRLVAIVALLAAAVAAVASLLPPPAPTAADEAVVEYVVDGDTVDLLFGDVERRVRLLNIDAPEGPHSATDAQCLADEARDHLTDLLPEGATVRVEEFGEDRYGRLLAGVFLADGRLVNAEVVRAGLAAPLVVGGNEALLEPVLAAREEAARTASGLHAAQGCTLPGRAAAARGALAETPPTMEPGEARRLLPRARAVRADVAELQAELDADERNALLQGLTDADARRLRREVADLTGASTRLVEVLERAAA